MVDATTHSVQSSIIQSFLDRRGRTNFLLFTKASLLMFFGLSTLGSTASASTSTLTSSSTLVYVPRCEIEILLPLLPTSTAAAFPTTQRNNGD